MGTKYEVNSSTGLITTDAGILLPTTGGTGDTLDYYEEATHSMDFDSDLYSGTFTLVFRIVRIGKLVSLTWNTVVKAMTGGTGADNLVTTPALELPARFRPSSYGARAAGRGLDSGANVATTMRVNTTGDMNIGSGNFSGDAFSFNSGLQVGVFGSNITYVVT